MLGLATTKASASHLVSSKSRLDEEAEETVIPRVDTLVGTATIDISPLVDAKSNGMSEIDAKATWAGDVQMQCDTRDEPSVSCRIMLNPLQGAVPQDDNLSDAASSRPETAASTTSQKGAKKKKKKKK